MSNPDVPGPYWQEPADAGYGGASYGGARRGQGSSYRDSSAVRAGGSSPSRAPRDGFPASPRGSEDPRDQQRGGGRRARPGSGADPASDGGGGESRYRGRRAAGPAGGSAERSPQASRGSRGYQPEQAAGSGQVAQDLRDRLGVRGPGNGSGPNGAGRSRSGPRNGQGDGGSRGGQRAAAGYAAASNGRTLQSDRPGAAGDAGWDGRGNGPRTAGRGRSSGSGGHGGGYGDGPGGRGGSGGGRRSFKEWLLYGSWWRHWTLKKALAVFCGACVGVVVLVAVGFFVIYEQTPIPTDAAAIATAQPSQVYYSGGKHLLGTFNDNGLSRQVLTAQQIPTVMDNAMIAAEDRHFYSEGGISVTGLLRATYEDVKGGGYSQGASTLTEQLVKNYYAGFASSDNSDKSVTDKLKQMMVAIKLAHAKSKSWILTHYLNTVPFGENAYGVGAASQLYFGIPAKKLDVSQAAMLAAMPNSPGFFSPLQSAGAGYTALVARWKYVLTNMVRDGALTQAQASKQHFPRKVHLHLSSSLSGYRGYLMQMVGQELTSTYHLSQAELDNGGLKITTTFSPAMMNGLYRTVAAEKLQMREDGQALPSYAYIGAVLEKPSTGAILAVYGGPGYTSNYKKCLREDCDLNMAENPKQVGSSFKPYVLATAVSQGMDVQDSVLDGYSPLWIPEGQSTTDRMQLSSRTAPADPAGYLPFNEADENSGPLTVAKAAAISSDPAFEDLAHRDGVQNVINMAKSFGVGQDPFNETSGNDWTAMNDQFGVSSKASTAGSVAIALGESDITAVEQASTFATLADGGIYNSPHVVARIVRGSGVMPLRIQTHQVLTPSAAADEDYALSFDNMAGGTAYPDAAWPGRQVIGKTGTTQTAQDAWFLGAIPQYSMAVTLFTNKQDSASGAGAQTLDILPDLPGNATGGYGGAWPAKIWDTFMTTQFATLPADPLPTPDYTGFTLWNQVTGQMAPTPPAPATTAPATTAPPTTAPPTSAPPASAPPTPTVSPTTSCTPSPETPCVGGVPPG